MATVSSVSTPQAGELDIRFAASLTGSSGTWLNQLAAREWAQDVYLAGSSALALHLGHRPVAGLDIMCPSNRLVGPNRRDLLGELLELDGGLRVETARDGFLYARAADSLALRFFYYPYPLIEPEHEHLGFPVASAIDLGLMKIAALISRGSKRDFVDLYLLCRQLPLATLLERSSDKFGHVLDFKLQALKALADQSMLDHEPMPRLEQALEWERVATWLATDARTIARHYVGLENETSDPSEETE